jgi:uncharacterized protein
MTARILWSPWSEPGLEDLILGDDTGRPTADGMIVGIEREVPFRVRYRIRCDERWRVRSMRVEMTVEKLAVVDLQSDGEGSWRDASGIELPDLAGCVDVDISATPFTNTLPIRRLTLRRGQTAEINVVYVDVPALRFHPARQRYTCVEEEPHRRYRFQSLPEGSVYEIPVDAEGIVLDYPGVFRRVWPR